MSRLLGSSNEPWRLSDAVDALAASARQAGAPGLLWIAGLFYPGLGLKVGEGGESLITGLRGAVFSQGNEIAESALGLGGLLIVLLLFGFRLVTGLAHLSPPETWRRTSGTRRCPRLRDAWQAGKGLTFSAAGLWIGLLILWAGAILFLLGPLALLSQVGLVDFLHMPGFILAGPLVGLLACYGLLLSVLYQLALHSLVQNRRGAASALTHAWRLVRNDPWAAGRATLVDFALTLTTFLLALVLAMMCLWPLALCIAGFAGVTRAGYWARNYRALGGLAPADEVPGLGAVPR